MYGDGQACGVNLSHAGELTVRKGMIIALYSILIFMKCLELNLTKCKYSYSYLKQSPVLNNQKVEYVSDLSGECLYEG